MAELVAENRQQQSSENETVSQRKGATVLQDKRDQGRQARALTDNRTAQLAPDPTPITNNTGLPNQLKAGIESLSGISMDHVKVHYNSSQPAQLNAHAYAQGSDIHLAPGQEKHLPHEAWHVVQQAQGRVKPTVQMKGGVLVNDNAGLEYEADVMGGKGLREASVQLHKSGNVGTPPLYESQEIPNAVVQRASSVTYDTTAFDLESQDNEREIVGHKMVAHLEQGDQIRGSAPGDGVQSLLMGALKNHGYKRMIRGHLLNGQFGGLGIAANLFPITASANSKHKNHVENPIKDQIKKGKDIEYSVTVSSQNKVSNPNATFICAASTTDGTWTRNETIQSTPSKNATSGTTVEGNILNGVDSMSFKTSDMPKGWGEHGKGFSNSSTAHLNTLSKYSMNFNGDSHNLDKEIYAKGKHFNKGEIDRAGYAHELIEKYNEDVSNKWPIYFDSKAYTNKEIDDYIDTASADVIEKIITRMENLI